ncbi:MAG: hypothetical protein DMF64_07745 [Acidobacteria bacterium]|nr:MAG: hypothetical protein DMF64_07745 [Acidobacteriota bacterium]
MADFRMVVLGDSVTWGQGLLTEEKFYSLVKRALTGTNGAQGCTVLAHSGATIGANVQTTEPRVDGEVPTSYPTIIQQCDAFTDAPDAVDFVLLNGGINDIDVRLLLNPITDTKDLHDMILLFCYRDMKLLLGKVVNRFTKPTAKIVVTSYFPVLSEQSLPPLVHAFLALYGVSSGMFFPHLAEQIVAKVVANCTQFWNESNAVFQQAVNEVNAQAGGAPRVFFAQPPFTAANSALAPNAWLWGVNFNLSPQDPVQAARHQSCNAHEQDPIQREICYRASAGHPNLTGAQQFANAILAVIQ